ncbi:MAG: GNAT family protein [Solirubrobacterales bacterium]
MNVRRSGGPVGQDARVEASPVQIRPATAADAESFVAASIASADLHGPWIEPPRTATAYAEMLRRAEAPNRFQYLVIAPDGGIGGTVTVGDIVRGNFQSAYLGYAAFAPHAGRGLMTAGLAAVVDRAFTELRLHRLEANVQPGNLPSAALVRRLGFRLEGHSPRYLAVLGEWRDHDRWAITSEDWRGPLPRD